MDASQLQSNAITQTMDDNKNNKSNQVDKTTVIQNDLSQNNFNNDNNNNMNSNDNDNMDNNNLDNDNDDNNSNNNTNQVVQTTVNQNNDIDNDNNNINDLFCHSAVQNQAKFEEYVSLLKKKYPHKNINFMIQNMRDSNGMSYLHCACVYDCFEIISQLINDYNININDIDNNGYSPIFYTISNLDEQCLLKLLENHANILIETTDFKIESIGFPIYMCGGQNIFHIIAEKNELKCLQPLFKYLINEYYDKMINILMKKDFNGCSPIDIAQIYNRKNILNEINKFIRKYSVNNNIINNLNDNITINKDQRDKMKINLQLKIKERMKLNEVKYTKINQHNDIFKNEQTNYAVFVSDKLNPDQKQKEKELFGMIREIKIFDQFDDELYSKLAAKYNKNEGICGHIITSVSEYVIETLMKNSNDNKLEFIFNDAILENIISKYLCDGRIIKLIEKSIQFTLKCRNQYILNNKNKFATNDDIINYLGLPCANFEISDCIQYEMNNIISSKIVFIRMNNLNYLNQSKYELKERILKDEKQFVSEIFIIELFSPRILIKCCQFKKELKKRNINPKCMMYLFDLNGHYNCGFPITIQNERNIVVIDTYTGNHVKNPTVLKCFELVFDCILH